MECPPSGPDCQMMVALPAGSTTSPGDPTSEPLVESVKGAAGTPLSGMRVAWMLVAAGVNCGQTIVAVPAASTATGAALSKRSKLATVIAARAAPDAGICTARTTAP